MECVNEHLADLLSCAADFKDGFTGEVYREAARRLRACKCQDAISPQPTIRECLDAAHAAGGSVWDSVADPEAMIREYRGEVQPPEIPAESTGNV